MECDLLGWPKKLFASKAFVAEKPVAVPWKLLVPGLVIALITPPAVLRTLRIVGGQDRKFLNRDPRRVGLPPHCPAIRSNSHLTLSVDAMVVSVGRCH